MSKYPFGVWVNRADVMACGYVCRDGRVSPMQFDARQFPSLEAATDFIRDKRWVNSTSVMPGQVTAYVVECHLLGVSNG